jgi:hypothetical protein
MSSGWRVRGDVVHVDRGARSHVVGSGSYATGSHRLAADVRLAPLSLATVNRLAPAARLRGDVTGRVRAEGTPSDLHVAGSLQSAAGGGTLDVNGSVALRGARTRYDVVAVTDRFDASALTTRARSSSLTGTIAARGVGITPATANVVARIDLTDSRWDTLRVDRLRTRLAVADGLARLDTLSLLARGANVQAARSDWMRGISVSCDSSPPSTRSASCGRGSARRIRVSYRQSRSSAPGWRRRSGIRCGAPMRCASNGWRWGFRKG